MPGSNQDTRGDFSLYRSPCLPRFPSSFGAELARKEANRHSKERNRHLKAESVRERANRQWGSIELALETCYVTWETDFYTPPVLGGAGRFDNSAPAVYKIQGP